MGNDYLYLRTNHASRYRDLIRKLQDAHNLMVAGPGVAKDATLHGAAATALQEMIEEVEKKDLELQKYGDKARERDERLSWGTLIPEEELYPDYFDLQATKTGAAFRGRLEGNRIYTRRTRGILLPMPGSVYKHRDSGQNYLVLMCEDYENSAIAHIAPFTGELPPTKS